MNFRLKNFIVSVIFPFLLILFLRISSFEGFILYGVTFIGFIIQYFLNFWLLSFNVPPQGFVTVLLLPSIWTGAISVIAYRFIFDLKAVYQLLSFLVIFVFQYYFLTTQSILNLSYSKIVSLSQAAYTTNNFYTILTYFFSLIALFLVPGNALIKLFLSNIFFALILFIFITLHKIERLQFYYSVFLNFTVVVILSILVLLGFLSIDEIILVCILLSLLFRGILIFLLFSSRKIISFSDYFQIFTEVILGGGVLYYISNFSI